MNLNPGEITAAVFIVIVAGLIIVVTYFLPTIMAVVRRHPSGVAIYLLNLFLGWTLIGWVAALVWSSRVDEHHR